MLYKGNNLLSTPNASNDSNFCNVNNKGNSNNNNASNTDGGVAPDFFGRIDLFSRKSFIRKEIVAFQH